MEREFPSRRDATKSTFPFLDNLLSQIFHHHPNNPINNLKNRKSESPTTIMSSPGHRRQRSSQSATPRRSSQRNAVPNSPLDPSAAQLQHEAASSQGAVNGTTRHLAPSSSPMMYRSSPAEIARSNRERDVSSPLRQMTNSQPTQDGERTPRASGLTGIGGEFPIFDKRELC